MSSLLNFDDPMIYSSSWSSLSQDLMNPSSSSVMQDESYSDSSLGALLHPLQASSASSASSASEQEDFSARQYTPDFYFSSLQEFEENMENFVKKIYPANFIPPGTLLFHGSLNSQEELIKSTYMPEITFFGLEPSISIWKNIENIELNEEKMMEMREKDYINYVHIFILNTYLPFEYIKNVRDHPDDVCQGKICLHPQVAYHGNPYEFTGQEYNSNMALELTIGGGINMFDNQYFNYVGTYKFVEKDVRDIKQLQFVENIESLEYIYGIFGGYKNENINKAVIEIAQIDDSLESSIYDDD